MGKTESLFSKIQKILSGVIFLIKNVKVTHALLLFPVEIKAKLYSIGSPKDDFNELVMASE